MKQRYKIIGNIVKDCELCGSHETLLVINDNEKDKIICRCDTCKPRELKGSDKCPYQDSWCEDCKQCKLKEKC